MHTHAHMCTLGLDKLFCLLFYSSMLAKATHYSSKFCPIFSLILSKYICDCSSLALPAAVKLEESRPRSRSVVSMLSVSESDSMKVTGTCSKVKGRMHISSMIRLPIILDYSLLFILAYYSTNYARIICQALVHTYTYYWFTKKIQFFCRVIDHKKICTNFVTYAQNVLSTYTHVDAHMRI